MQNSAIGDVIHSRAATFAVDSNRSNVDTFARRMRKQYTEPVPKPMADRLVGEKVARNIFRAQQDAAVMCPRATPVAALHTSLKARIDQLDSAKKYHHDRTALGTSSHPDYDTERVALLSRTIEELGTVIRTLETEFADQF